MNKRIAVFLPAAGLGERLRPITNHLPKPLLPVLGKPVIEIILERLAPVCSGGIGINLHYKGEMVREWAENSQYAGRAVFFPEDPILGTGGALKNAREFLSGGLFLVHNADILLEIDFHRLMETHISEGNIATLVTHRHPRLSNVVLDGEDLVTGVENPGESRPDPARAGRKTAYTGIALYSPGILDFLPDGVSHATQAWVAASAAGRRVRALDFTGCRWNDIGTPATYAAAILQSLSLNGETVYRSPEARCGDIEADGYLVLESGCKVENGSRLRNCVLMPGARVSGDHENRIIGPDYILELSGSEMQPPLHAAEKKRVFLSDPLFARRFRRFSGGGRPGLAGDKAFDAALVGFGGSDRRYFRVRSGGESVILMECHPDDPDFERHIEYTAFFLKAGVPVPALLAVDWKGKRALFEDLGDCSLYSYLKLPRERGLIAEIYRGIMGVLAGLHTRAYRGIGECPLLAARRFDYDHLRWETDYFLERFVKGLPGRPARNLSGLEKDFHELASLVDSFPKTVIHRDFQSQNVMITKGTIPRVIDYQGARIGPPAYDLASVLWDPYCMLDAGLREEMLSYYAGLRRAADGSFSEDGFRETILPCRLQRHMQALGAYGFLSGAKGKKYFLKHVPNALRLLKEDIAGADGAFPELSGLLEGLDYPF